MGGWRWGTNGGSGVGCPWGGGEYSIYTKLLAKGTIGKSAQWNHGDPRCTRSKKGASTVFHFWGGGGGGCHVAC